MSIRIAAGRVFIVLSILFSIAARAADAPPHAAGLGNPLDSLPKTERQPPAAVTVDIQKKAEDPALTRLLSTRIVPASFEIAGVRAVPFETVAAEFAGLAGHEVSIADILAAADRVTAIYRDKGYPLSFAFVPAQSFDRNIVQVNVVEGYVSTVTVTGNPGAGAERLIGIAEQLKNERPLTSRGFEHVTAILALQRGMQIDATVSPPVTTDGAAAMELKVTRKPVTASLGIDTAASRLRGIASVSVNNLTPWGEQATFSVLAPPGSTHERYYGVNYNQPLGISGTMLQADLSDYRSEPVSGSLEALSLDARYRTKLQRAGLVLSTPLILDNHRNLTLSGGVYAVRNSSLYNRSVPAIPPTVEISSDIRALSLELAWTASDAVSVEQLSGGVYHGFDIAGAGVVNSNADLRFTRAKLQFAYAHTLPAGFGLALGGLGQYSADDLPLSEQVSFGGKLFGAAYPSGEIAGDKGWGASVEINRAFLFDMKYLKQLQPYVLLDAAQTSFNTGGAAKSNLASIATGVRFSDQHHYSLDISAAKPTGDRTLSGNDRSLRLNLSYTYQVD